MGLLDDLRRAAARSPAGSAENAAPLRPSGRVGGRLEREPLRRVAPAPPAMPPSPAPSGDDFRRKVEAMASGEPESLGALPVQPALPYDLGPDDKAAPPPSLQRRDLLRGIILGEALGPPKGSRPRAR